MVNVGLADGRDPRKTMLMNDPCCPVAVQDVSDAPSPTDPTVRCFRALSDPTRLRLLEFILAGERTAAECKDHVGISQPRISVHLSVLVECGYVFARREGRTLHYRIGDPRVRELIGLARLLAHDKVYPTGF